MEGTVAGVRIVPPVVEFFDAETEVLHQMTLTVQNLSKASRNIRFHGPATSQKFKIRAKNPDNAIAPGLEVSAIVEYYTTENEDSQDRVILTVDNDVIEVPLVAYAPCSQLELSGPANFGVIVADSRVLSRQIAIFNEGSTAGEFKIKYTGNKPITIMPTSGVVQPGHSQMIKIEFIAKTPGPFHELAQVKIEGQPSASLEIYGQVVERSLELLTLDGSQRVDCINFGGAYYGTDTVKSFMIYNGSPDVANFVVILEEGGEGQEVGVDLTKTTSAVLATQALQEELGTTNDLTSLVTALPSQGVLGPGERSVIHFCFSPRFTRSNKGWKMLDQPPPRRDFALFMHIETVGSVNTAAVKNGHGRNGTGGPRIEVGVVGTALPVLLSVSPRPVFNFGQCTVDEQIDALCILNNDSENLPVSFSIHKIAHFHTQPKQGSIKAGKSADFVLSFQPNQIGQFKTILPVDVLGSVVENFSMEAKDPTAMRAITIHTVNIQLHGSGALSANIKQHLQTNKDNGIAQPNDRATSIRPANKKEKIKTLFTGTERYTYTDPDYAYTDEEERQREEHKQQYLDYIDDLRTKRKVDQKKREFENLNNDLDIGIKTGKGLRAPKLSVKEIVPPAKAPSPVSKDVKLLSSKVLAEEKSRSLTKPISDGLNAVPMTDREKSDCSKRLTPQELKQLDISPSLIDFGQVCLHSVSSKDLMIVNNLDSYIHIVARIDSRELRQTSPLSQVVPPRSLAKLTLMFESNSKGHFERSVDYIINGNHHQHIIVLAEVVPVDLEISSEEITLKPSPGMLYESGLQGSITVYNKRNYPAEFRWEAAKYEAPFFIKPNQGMVEAYTNLVCQVSYMPSFSAVDEADFAMHVIGGATKTLKCKAKLGTAHCAFIERRLLFGPVPLNLTTTKTVSLKNTSHNHAFFEIVDVQPIPSMMISPKEGVVPVGGTTEITVQFHPDSVHKFDTNIQVNIRCGKMITLRVGGTVEPPSVDIDVDSFRFGGVYCGALSKIPFKMNNLARTEARLELDLSRHQDFSLKVFDVDEIDEPVYRGDGIYCLTLAPRQTIDCTLEFSPSEVAAYDFVIPVIINNILAPTPPPSVYPPTPSPSRTNWTISDLATPIPCISGMATPSRRVISTALRPPLQLSHSSLSFSLPSGYYDLGIESGAGRAQGCMFVNNSDRTLSWTLHILEGGPLLEDGTFKFLHRTGSPFTPSSARRKSTIPSITLESGETFQLGVLFSPPAPGLYIAHVPVILDDDRNNPYRILELRGELKAASLKFEPGSICISPAPLEIPVSVDFKIIASGFRRATTVSCEVPVTELEDGSVATVLDVSFPDGQTIRPCCADKDQEDDYCVVNGRITFKSPSPVSFSCVVTFTDGKNRYELPVTATADNCLLTSYHFLAAHREDYQIVCGQEQHGSIQENSTDGAKPISGEAIMKPCLTPNRPNTQASTTETSTTFGISSSSYQESTNSATSSTFPSTPHHVEQDEAVRDTTVLSDDQATLSVFSNTNDTEKKFLSSVVLAIQRWFTVQGWSSGPYPITIPQSLSMALQDLSEVPSGTTAATRTTNWDNNSKKEMRSVFDLVAHLCGRSVPGIPLTSALPTNPTERVRQIHWMYSTFLTFLRTQGAMLSGVKPEYLLAPGDYRIWRKLQKKTDPNEILDDEMKQKQLKEDRRDLDRFGSVSTKSWTDVLAQIIKVLILSRVTPQQYKKLQSPFRDKPSPVFNPDPVVSNVYSVGERVLLSWINHHYDMQRQKQWHGSMDGSNPSCRWIVNFDLDFMDGLVLAALLSAFVPFLVSTHLYSLYMRPITSQHCLHNVQKVVQALRHIGMDYDVQPADITEPNPISIMLLCLHLYQRLPQYLPRTTVEFQGPLHATVVKHIRLQNPSNKPLSYQVILAGRDAADFKVPMGDSVQVPAKGQLQLPVEFKSRFLRPGSATLVLVGKRVGSPCGNTLVFNLDTCINNITPVATIRCESPTYELQKVQFDVTNPFSSPGDFRIVLVEAKLSFPGTTSTTSPRSKPSMPKKNVPSRTDHGQTSNPRSPAKEMLPRIEQERPESPKSSPTPQLSAFWCANPTVHLNANDTALVEVHFLPFTTGHRQCSILFINDKVGEFLYSIEANALLPLPSPLPVVESPHSLRISSAAAARSSRGVFGGDDRVVYWKSENSEKFTEELHVPLYNVARENALAIAAQQRMSQRELNRRQLTGTLSSSTVTAKIAAIGLGNEKFIHASDPVLKNSLELAQTKFNAETSSKYYKVPKYVTIPACNEQSSASSARHRKNTKDTAKIPITFEPKGPGHYPCQVILRSAHDIRVYQVECTVSPKGAALEMEFNAPTHQSVTQDIPVVNHSQQDWQLTATLEGEGFYGPPVLLAKALVTTPYPLMFRPSHEGPSQGQLVLNNTADGTEQIYRLSGMGEKPLALDNIIVECEAGKSITHVLAVPNMTKKKVTFQVLTDLEIVSGSSSITVLPSQTAEHVVKVSPWKRGKFTGMVSFTAISETEITPVTARIEDTDSEDEDSRVKKPDHSSSERGTSPGAITDPPSRPYRLWYSIEVQASAPSQEKTIEVTCAAHSAVSVEIEVSNPTREKADIDIIIDGVGLDGDATITVHPRQKAIYRLHFSPTKIGEFKGSVIFQHPVLAEFWYDLVLHATAPSPSHLPIMHCEIGKSTYQMIRLQNPTKETLLFTPYCSNTRNFSLEIDVSKQLPLAPLSILEVPLKFTPSDIGHGNHTAEIVFHSLELGDWAFLASGTGRMPGTNEPINIFSELGGNSSIIIPFRNPTEQEVVVDVVMKERMLSRSGSMFSTLRDQETDSKESTFCLLLKHPTSIKLAPNATLDIPISFAPDTMQIYEATITIVMHRHDGTQWDNRDGLSGSCIMNDLQWIYPVKGVPESCPLKESQAPCIECKARGRVEERLEVTLTGVAPSSTSTSYASYLRTLTPIQILPNEWDYGSDYINVPEEFRYEVIYEDAEGQAALERSLGVSLIRKARNQVSGIISLIFNFVFSPFKPFSHRAQLVVSAVTGGVWRFPFRVLATEPEVDDVINMEAAGLNKESFVGFRLTSQTRHVLPFEAYFATGSDSEFSVTPSCGELLPFGSEGTLIKICYKPTLYGKTHRAKLIIQTSDMQWTYDIYGTTPDYTPPNSQSKVVSSAQTQKRSVRQKKNYVLENLRLPNTAVSSPLKGAPLVSRSNKTM